MVAVKKFKIFSSLFLSKIGQETMLSCVEIMLCYDLERKKAFQDDKNDNFVKSKKCLFSKVVNPWFRSKNSKFFLVFFVLSEIGLKRMLSCGLEGKEAFQDNKNVNFLKCEKWVFSKGVNPWVWSKI